MTKLRMLVVIGAAAVGAVVGGVAWATIPSSGNVFNACLLKATGTIRLIDKDQPASSLLGHCTALEKEISWKPRGLARTPGRRRPAGATRADRCRRPAGRTGTTGPPGPGLSPPR